jgi:hypothetical protein
MSSSGTSASDAAGQHRLDDPAHPRLAQLVGELVEVGDPLLNQLLLGQIDQCPIDRAGAIPTG